MRQNHFLSGEAAMAENRTTAGQLTANTANFNCAHCLAFAQHEWGIVRSIRRAGGHSTNLADEPPYTQISVCTACKRQTVYVGCRQVYPAIIEAPNPDPDMPDEIKADFNEARTIHKLSPRGAAALLRLCIEKLLPYMGAETDNINASIKAMVEKGTISVTVQQALDAVRVIGNEGVHPATLDLRDDTQTVSTLFNLVNFIVEKGIGDPKRVEEIFRTLPPVKLKGIADRDAPAHAARAIIETAEAATIEADQR